MTWKPQKAAGIASGLIVLAVIAGAMTVIIRSLSHQGADLGAVLTAVVLAVTLWAFVRWAILMHGLLALRYELDRNGLVIRYGVYEHTIPIGAIVDISEARPMALPNERIAPIWPGYYWSQSSCDASRPIWVHATSPQDGQLLVQTDKAMYAISPSNPERFLEDYALRRNMGPVRQVEQTTMAVGIAAWPIWRNRRYWTAVLLATLANLVLYGLYVSGMGTAITRDPWDLGSLLAPMVGSLILGANLLAGIILYRLEHVATWLLVASAFLAQIILASSALPV